jgi:hypothetical protein
MIPEFPLFKRLELSDKEEVEAVTSLYPPYSDFDFASLWAWDIREKMKLSMLNGNLVVNFTDYITGDPFYSFLGSKEIEKTMSDLFTYFDKKGIEKKLKLIPEIAIEGMDAQKYLIEEDRDNFDYIYEIKHHLTYEGSTYKVHRNSMNSFTRRHVHFNVTLLDLHEQKVREDILRLYDACEAKKGVLIPNEDAALQRFLASAEHFDCIAVGVMVHNELVAYKINHKVQTNYSNCLFAKADISYAGIYSFLMYATSHTLSGQQHEFLNYEQDLGLLNLRKAKMSFNPRHFLKKYSVSLR